MQQNNAMFWGGQLRLVYLAGRLRGLFSDVTGKLGHPEPHLLSMYLLYMYAVLFTKP